MSKLLLLSHIKQFSTFKSFSPHVNIILILSTAKKASELSFYFRLKKYVLMVSTLAFVFKIIRLIIFSAVKKDFLCKQRFFLDQRRFSQTKFFP